MMHWQGSQRHKLGMWRTMRQAPLSHDQPGYQVNWTMPAMPFIPVVACLCLWLCPVVSASSHPNQPISPTIITAPTTTAKTPEPQPILPAPPLPKLHIVTEHFPPFQIKHADSLDGWAVQRVLALLAHADLASNIEVLPWPRAYKMATTRPNTLIFSLLKTEERQPQFHWIAPLCPMHIGFYTAESRADINATTIDALKPYVIGVERGQANQHYLEKHGFIVDKNLVLVQHKDVLHQMLALGRVDVVLLSQHYVQQWQQQHPDQPALKPLFVATDLAQMLYIAAHLDTDPAVIARLMQAWQYLAKRPQSPCPIEML